MNAMRPPFPAYGGKSRFAAAIWEHFGPERDCVYVEPFVLSGAVLLHNPDPCRREIICDLDGHVANFWRALRDDPDAVAYYADWPTVHQDLTARRLWLARWGVEYAEAVASDPHWYDAQAAGYWVWGMSQWIGGGWPGVDRDKRPHVDHKGGGTALQHQRTGTPGRIPHVDHNGRGQGLQHQRAGTPGQMPRVDTEGAGQGLQHQRAGTPGARPHVKGKGGGTALQHQRVGTPYGGDAWEACTGERWRPWMRAIADRLKRVVVLGRDFESALTPSVTGRTRSSPKRPLRVFLDPPYRTTRRSSGLYASDADGTSDDTAVRAYHRALALAEMPDTIVAYACHEGDFPVPSGWCVIARSISVKRPETRRDIVMVSPSEYSHAHCETAHSTMACAD